MAEDTGMSPVV